LEESKKKEKEEERGERMGEGKIKAERKQRKEGKNDERGRKEAERKEERQSNKGRKEGRLEDERRRMVRERREAEVVAHILCGQADTANYHEHEHAAEYMNTKRLVINELQGT
jgi:hypothetical protein